MAYELLDRCEAIDDDGNEYTVDVYKDVVEWTTIAGATMKSVLRIDLSVEGEPVQVIDKASRTLRISYTGVTIRLLEEAEWLR